MAHKVASLGSLARGFKEQDFPLIGSLFMQAAEGVALAMEDMTAHPLLRAKVMMFLHRMVPLLGKNILSVAGRCLAQYITYASAVDVDQSVTLLNQLLEKFGVETFEAVDVFLGPLMEKLAGLYSAAGAEGSTENQVISDRFAIQKLCISFIMHVAASPCARVLVSVRNAPRLQGIFDTIMHALSGGEATSMGATTTVPLRRAALGTLTNLSKAWAADGTVDGSLRASLSKLVMEQAMPQTLTFCLMESNARDAATLSLYADVGSLFYTVGKAYGNAQFVGYLGTTLLPYLLLSVILQ